MGPSIPSGTILLLKAIDRDAIIPGSEYVIVGRKIVTLRTVRTSPEDERVRLVAGDRENYDDIVLNINDIVAVYKIKGKLTVTN